MTPALSQHLRDMGILPPVTLPDPIPPYVAWKPTYKGEEPPW